MSYITMEIWTGIWILVRLFPMALIIFAGVMIIEVGIEFIQKKKIEVKILNWLYDFLENRYGKENVVQAIVHDDEGGQPHLHFCFIPVEEDPKHEQGYKICANDVLDRRELRNFHPDLQRYLDEHGLEDAHVMTGVTKRQGGNRTVAQLKAEREQEYQQNEERPA